MPQAHATPNALSAPQSPADLPAPPIAREGWPIVAGFLVVSCLLTSLALWLLGPWGWLVCAACLPLCLWCIWFFRDPARSIPPARADALPLISPADGVICFVGPGQPPAELSLTDSTAFIRVSVFMNVFNVHVNRSPIAGVVETIAYRPGKFFNASFDKASELNERSAIVVRSPSGVRIPCVQIAGLIARRIVCRVKPGDTLATAQRFGLIRFGSRVDVYLPEGISPLINVGDRSIAGETILAWIPTSS